MSDIPSRPDAYRSRPSRAVHALDPAKDFIVPRSLYPALAQEAARLGFAKPDALAHALEQEMLHYRQAQEGLSEMPLWAERLEISGRKKPLLQQDKKDARKNGDTERAELIGLVRKILRVGPEAYLAALRDSHRSTSPQESRIAEYFARQPLPPGFDAERVEEGLRATLDFYRRCSPEDAERMAQRQTCVAFDHHLKPFGTAAIVSFSKGTYLGIAIIKQAEAWLTRETLPPEGTPDKAAPSAKASLVDRRDQAISAALERLIAQPAVAHRA